MQEMEARSVVAGSTEHRLLSLAQVGAMISSHSVAV